MGRTGRVLAVLAVIVALLVGVEFGVRALVGSQLQQALTRTDLDLDRPTVELGGGSVLASLVQGRFVDLSGTAASAEVPFEDHRLPVSDVSYRASGIRLAGLSSAVVGSVDLTGTLGWSGLSDLAGLPVRYGGEGRVLVTYTVDVLGLRELEIGISSVPRLDAAAQRVELTRSRIDVAGIEISESLSQQIIDRVVKPISLAADDGVRVTAVSVAQGGLVASVTATDVPVGR